jgi:hypothetical protein
MPVSDTQASPFAALLQLQIPAGEDLYNQLMAEIEPELLSENLPLLEQKYRGETPADAKARAERYTKAFEAYDKKLKGYLGELDEKVRGYQRQALKSAEAHEREEEDVKLHSIEDTFSSM